MDFTGKNVLITGGSRGIGRATAEAFAQRGARIAINFRSDSEAAGAACEALEGEGHFAIKADISRPDAVQHMMDVVLDEFGKLDILVNNAGIYVRHPIDQMDYEDWQERWEATLDVNLIGAANVCYCAVQYMRNSGGGRIINVSSRGAFRGEPNHPAYAASKAGLNAFSQSLAQAVAPYHIYVGVVAPGYVETDMTSDVLNSPDGEVLKAQSPLQRVAKPEEVAHSILFLASGGAEFNTGGIIDVNGASYLRS